jgi:hypothetical protein
VLFDRARWRGSNSHESTAAELERVSAFLKLDVAAMRARVEAAIAIPKTWPEKARAGFTW